MPLPDDPEMLAAIAAAKAFGPGACARLLSLNRGLIKSVIQKKIRMYPEYNREDLDREAESAVWNAARLYDPQRILPNGKPIRWINYAHRSVELTVKNYLRRFNKQIDPRVVKPSDRLDQMRAEPGAPAVDKCPPPKALALKTRDGVHRQVTPRIHYIAFNRVWCLCLAPVDYDDPAGFQVSEVGVEGPLMSVRPWLADGAGRRCPCPKWRKMRTCPHVEALRAAFPKEADP